MRKIVLFISLVYLSFSCNDKHNITHEKVIAPVDALEPNVHINISIQESIIHLDSLVSSYNIELKHKFPFDSHITKPAIYKLRSENEDTLKYYLTLLMIKKYKFHIECCRQGFELRNPKSGHSVGVDSLIDPMLYEFLRFSESYDQYGYTIDSLLTKRFEYMNSSIIMHWIEKEPKYIQYDSINGYYNYIKEIERKGDYW